jgi:hypothetical protein
MKIEPQLYTYVNESFEIILLTVNLKNCEFKHSKALNVYKESNQ